VLVVPEINNAYWGDYQEVNQEVIQDANEAALQEFEAGLARSISQYKAGLVKTFKTKEDFLDHLKNLE
jgi:hypothetical protein